MGPCTPCLPVVPLGTLAIPRYAVLVFRCQRKCTVCRKAINIGFGEVTCSFRVYFKVIIKGLKRGTERVKAAVKPDLVQSLER